ncbi:serine protease inhibitor 28Dc-like isoform X4 [Armigeres subalbatus]|uniref:serine protease inhibitor 28Dc-like isoform X4 n=1 Tax=Armigeres subalbatus TaxID=124917 RepID=UPI002ED5CD99
MRILAPVGLVVLVIISYCQGQNQDSTVGSTPENLAAVSQSVTNLAQKISLAIANPKSKTEIFSPVSIAGALSLLLLGSGGATRDELINVMGFQNSRLSFTDIHKSFGRLFQDLVSNEPAQNVNIPWRANDKCNNYDYDEEDYVQQKPSSPQRGRRDTEEPVEIKIANGVFAPKGMQFDPKFQLIAERFYGLDTHHVDFKTKMQNAIQTINAWIKRLSRGRISDIVAQLDTSSMLVMTNTLFFKAKWEVPFIMGGTKSKPFFIDGPNKPAIEVPMMVNGGCFPFYYWQEMNTKVLGIPYKRNITLYAFLPDNPTKEKVRTLQLNINATALNEIINKMEMKMAAVQFPKLHVQNFLNLRQTLDQLGVTKMFNRDESDLNRIWLNRSSVTIHDYMDAFDFLEDTRENAIIELRHQHNDCVIIEKDVSSRVLCEESILCRYKGGQCICCAVLASAKRRQKRYNGYFNSHLFVNEILHKIDLVVNESGTESGAAVIPFMDKNFPQVNFKVNGPFLVLIRDEKTQLPLYYGGIFDPRF